MSCLWLPAAHTAVILVPWWPGDPLATLDSTGGNWGQRTQLRPTVSVFHKCLCAPWVCRPAHERWSTALHARSAAGLGPDICICHLNSPVLDDLFLFRCHRTFLKLRVCPFFVFIPPWWSYPGPLSAVRDARVLCYLDAPPPTPGKNLTITCCQAYEREILRTLILWQMRPHDQDIWEYSVLVLAPFLIPRIRQGLWALCLSWARLLKTSVSPVFLTASAGQRWEEGKGFEGSGETRWERVQEASVPQLGLTPFPLLWVSKGGACVYTCACVRVGVCMSACSRYGTLAILNRQGHSTVTAYQGIALVQIISISYIGPKC